MENGAVKGRAISGYKRVIVTLLQLLSSLSQEIIVVSRVCLFVFSLQRRVDSNIVLRSFQLLEESIGMRRI